MAVVYLSAVVQPVAASAEGVCLGPSAGPSPLRREENRVKSWDTQVVAQTDCRRGVLVDFSARRDLAGDRAPMATAEHPLGPSGIYTIPIYCRRDDYMFLPPDALAGLPCASGSIPSQEAFDPRPLAVRMAAELPPPDLRIGMNPAKGMVAVPTWFWVEGYDGARCHRARRCWSHTRGATSSSSGMVMVSRFWTKPCGRERAANARSTRPRSWSTCGCGPTISPGTLAITTVATSRAEARETAATPSGNRISIPFIPRQFSTRTDGPRSE